MLTFAPARDVVLVQRLHPTADGERRAVGVVLRDLPDGGMALLEDTLTHWRTNARLLQVMIGWWLEQPPSRGAVSLPTTFSQSLYDVLMHQRNLAWRETLLALPPGRYVVAVGALHLYGEGNLPDMLT